MSTNRIGQVLSCSPEAIIVLIDDLKVFEEHKSALQVGRYLRISQGNNQATGSRQRGQGATFNIRWRPSTETGLPNNWR